MECLGVVGSVGAFGMDHAEENFTETKLQTILEEKLPDAEDSELCGRTVHIDIVGVPK